MDRDRGATTVQGVESRKGRLMGKLFGGRERKVSSDQRKIATGGDEINAFLHGPSQASTSPTSPRSSTTARPSFDGFQVAHAAPPQLSKLDTRSISRYPNAVPVATGSQSPASGPFPSKPPRPGARGLHVRFANSYPEIIGEGGDESEIPVAEIGRRRRETRASPNPQASQSQTHGAPSYNLPPISPVLPLQAQFSAQLSAQLDAPPSAQHHHIQQQNQPRIHQTKDGTDDFVPVPLKRTQTGFTSIHDSSRSPRVPFVSSPRPEKHVSPERPVVADKAAPSLLAPANLFDALSLGGDEKRRTFIEAQQAEMRKAEGLALANALRNGPVSPPSSPEVDEKRPVSPLQSSPVKLSPPDVPPPRNPRHVLPQTVLLQNAIANSEASPIIPPPSTASTPDGVGAGAGAAWSRPRQVAQEHSPPLAASSTVLAHRALNAFRQNAASQRSRRDQEDKAMPSISTTSGGSVAPVRSPMASLHDAVQAASDDTLVTFVNRSRHLFELFRLQSETLRPLSACNASELARASLWWFLIGRMTLESTFRERSMQGADVPVSRTNEFAMQQAYADLAKAYWLVGEILPEKTGTEETDQARSAIMYQLRKLSVSMSRNNIMPPEDAFLPQTIDKTIWVTYPSISSDIVALLWGNWGSSLKSTPLTTAPMSMADALPLGDNSEDFVFSRMKADVYLMEQGRETNNPQEQFHFPCMLSVARPRSSALLEIIVASQNETVQLRVRGKKNTEGPTWDDVRWRSDMHSLELRLPRGFVLAVQLTKPDYGVLWSMYDFGTKVRSQLYPRRDETPVFHSTLKAFQYFETGPPTGSFPKEAVPDCEVALFEMVVQENAATGRRLFHRGFRLAVVSGTRTRTLYGVSEKFVPELPLQFNFLRGDQGDPALLLRFENSRSKGNMVLSFGHGDERTHLHSLLADKFVRQNERTSVDVPIMSLDVRLTAKAAMDAHSGNQALGAFKKLALKRLLIVNLDDEPDETAAPTVLSESLKMVYEYGDCTVVDRVNVAPGELKIRLDVRCSTSLTILRQGQQDLTVAIPDIQVAREMGPELAKALRVTKMAPTCRMLRFNTLADLHTIQQAITGYRVMYDGVATSLMIARRRLVVPIHKKWESGATRIQIVSHPDTKVVQLLVFFQDFHYGQSMSFVLKGTDVYEAFGRANKAGIKFDDAKFPLPRLPANDGGSSSGSNMLKNSNGSNASIGSSGGASSSSTSIVNGSFTGGVSSDNVSETAFVCLDMPDLPGEHDDISILFDKESERDRLAACLPAPVRGSRTAKKF